jgi:hypothetical protein
VPRSLREKLLSPQGASRGSYNQPVRGGDFDELAFFQAIAASGARALLIGRRALVLLGLPVLTADYDFWIAIDDIPSFNAAAAPFGLVPTRDPVDARSRGRYALENDEHVDVLVARSVPTTDDVTVQFDDVWERRREIALDGRTTVPVPSLNDLIRMNDRVARAIVRVVDRDEARAYLAHPISPEERAEFLALVRWFRRRYPTPAARLAYARRAYARWRDIRAAADAAPRN